MAMEIVRAGRAPILAVLLLLSPHVAFDVRSQTALLGSDALVAALRQGSNVIVMRHASSPREAPTRATADPDNTGLERQLDAAGRAAATATGAAIRRLGIPIGLVLTSPAYRARETARLAGWDRSQIYDELGDGGQSMQSATDAQSAWLRRRVAEPSAGVNVVVITHQPNIAKALPAASDVADGESLVCRPDGKGGATLIGRIKIDDWPRLRVAARGRL